MNSNTGENKRLIEEENEQKEEIKPVPQDLSEEESSEDEGPALPPVADMASSSVAPKKRKVEFDKSLRKTLPNAQNYEKSYQESDTIQYLAYAPKTDYLITSSNTGSLTFWKKLPVVCRSLGNRCCRESSSSRNSRRTARVSLACASA